ncbi:MAG TPA: metallophosphoesterase [Fimbriimonadaceae bacterium]|nr:metallophosphoesterase [Fimbriimonadaceae bacterium]
MTRREFFAAVSSALVAPPLARIIPMRPGPAWPAKTVRIAVIADLHHGLAPDALSRLQAFVDAVSKRKNLDAVMQMGDFCYSQPDSKECVDLWNKMPHPKIHVLGNHDMDKVDKEGAMRFFGMKRRYYSMPIGGYRFVVLDLNHFKKAGRLVSYANGNYFTDGASCNWADSEQLGWLGKELRASKEPVILISHQPLGFAEPGQPIPPEQAEVLKIIAEAARANPAGAVAASLFGHLHVDRLEQIDGVPFLCVNSASYFWFNGMQPYTKPLFAFLELTPDGYLKVEGASGEFVREPPKASDSVIGRSASISDRTLKVRRNLDRAYIL